MKYLFLAVIVTGLIFATSCKKEEMPMQTTSKQSQPVFKYDNTTLKGVLDAANYNWDKASGEPVLIEGTFKGINGPDENGSYSIDCANSKEVCIVVTIHKSSNEDKDIIIAAYDKPIVLKGSVDLINSKNGTKKYKVITNN